MVMMKQIKSKVSLRKLEIRYIHKSFQAHFSILFLKSMNRQFQISFRSYVFLKRGESHNSQLISMTHPSLAGLKGRLQQNLV